MPTPKDDEIESVRFEGYLEKQRKVKTWAWTKYWFIVEDGQLAYYKDSTKSEGAGLIDLGQANPIKPQPNATRNYCFEITMKNNRVHIFCTESEHLKDQWIQSLQDARVERLVQPQRSSSMMYPRCNSIAEESDPEEFLVIEDLEPPDTPRSIPGTPSSTTSSASTGAWSSPPNTPNSPIKFGSPKFQKATKGSPLLNSPKFQKSLPKRPSSPKVKEFLDPPAWVKNSIAGSSLPSSGNVELTGIRRLSDKGLAEKLSESSVGLIDMPEESNNTRPNSVFYLPTPIVTERKKEKKNVAIDKTSAKSDLKSKHSSNGLSSQVKLPATRAISHHAVVSRAYTPNPRPVIGTGSLARARPVSGERPIIESRTSAFKPSSISTSSESDSENPISSRKLKRVSSSERSRKTEIVSSKSSTGGVILRRNLAPTKSMPFIYRSMGSSTDSEPECESWSPKLKNQKEDVDEVFADAPVAVSPPVLRCVPHVRDDQYYETLCKDLHKPRPPIPSLNYPRLELTFRSAFDDIRLFLANNRKSDEIFPVPRLSERGGKAIKKLQKVLSDNTQN